MPGMVSTLALSNAARECQPKSLPPERAVGWKQSESAADQRGSVLHPFELETNARRVNISNAVMQSSEGSTAISWHRTNVRDNELAGCCDDRGKAELDVASGQ